MSASLACRDQEESHGALPAPRDRVPDLGQRWLPSWALAQSADLALDPGRRRQPRQRGGEPRGEASFQALVDPLALGRSLALSGSDSARTLGAREPLRNRGSPLADPRPGAGRGACSATPGRLSGALGLGQLFFSCDVFVRDQIHLGGAPLEVVGVEAGALRFRCVRSPAGTQPPKVLPARPRLRELGLYRFRDGRVLGVGKVTTLAMRDGSAVDVVTLSLFPPGYQQNPLQDYEVLPRLVAGKALGSSPLGRWKLHLAELRRGEGGSPGWIRLAE